MVERHDPVLKGGGINLVLFMWVRKLTHLQWHINTENRDDEGRDDV